MLKAMRKVPAGTFLIPMILSMLLYSFWPGLFRIGGPTEAFFSSAGTNYIIGLLVFASGTTVNLSRIAHLLKHQGVLSFLRSLFLLFLPLPFCLFSD